MLGDYIPIAIICGLLCSWVAEQKGHNRYGAFIGGLLFGPLAVLWWVALVENYFL